MYDYLLSINNKEVFIEILHHAIDYFIGNLGEHQMLRLPHKYGFQNIDDFISTIRYIASYYRNYFTKQCSESDLLFQFGNLNHEQRQLMSSTINARRHEVERYLLRCHNVRKYSLLKSFNWDLHMILGDSNYALNRQVIAMVTLNFHSINNKSTSVRFQISRHKLSQLIAELENAIANDFPKSNIEN